MLANHGDRPRASSPVRRRLPLPLSDGACDFSRPATSPSSPDDAWTSAPQASPQLVHQVPTATLPAAVVFVPIEKRALFRHDQLRAAVRGLELERGQRDGVLAFVGNASNPRSGVTPASVRSMVKMPWATMWFIGVLRPESV